MKLTDFVEGLSAEVKKADGSFERPQVGDQVEITYEARFKPGVDPNVIQTFLEDQGGGFSYDATNPLVAIKVDTTILTQYLMDNLIGGKATRLIRENPITGAEKRRFRSTEQFLDTYDTPPEDDGPANG